MWHGIILTNRLRFISLFVDINEMTKAERGPRINPRCCETFSSQAADNSAYSFKFTYVMLYF